MLKPTTRSRYALRAMIELGLHEGEGPIFLRQLAKTQSISTKYLEQIAMPLRRAGLLRAKQGTRGGYELARSSLDITARDIVEAVDGSLNLLECVSEETTCPKAAMCAARDLWVDASRCLTKVLEETTLADLCSNQRAKEPAANLSYQI